jgi:hypothetical protein
MRWSRAFIEVLLYFARRVAEVERIDMAEALLGWTPLYLNFNLGRSFDPTHPTWREFLTGYQRTTDPVGWTHAFYLAHAREYPPSPHGCFSYEYESAARCIRFHFANRDTSGLGPLSEERQQERRHELTGMFRNIRLHLPEAQAVRGRSWMYHLDAYCRLFPPDYIATAAPVDAELQFMSLWGQFLDHVGNVRPDGSRTFMQAVRVAATGDELLAAFPLTVLVLACGIEHFYACYGVEST